MMRHAPAPSAARTASSVRRRSERTSSRFMTFAHAISSTMPIVPITTQSTLPTLPTTSCISGRSAGVILQTPRYSSVPLLPFAIGNRSSQIGSIRARSAFACSIVTPGFRRAMPVPKNGAGANPTRG